MPRGIHIAKFLLSSHFSGLWYDHQPLQVVTLLCCLHACVLGRAYESCDSRHGGEPHGAVAQRQECRIAKRGEAEEEVDAEVAGAF
eukprot:2105988-Amphidinium_carterae.1